MVSLSGNTQTRKLDIVEGELPFVSVVVPTCNRWHTLEQTLAALCAQDYGTSSYEVIMVDDCSDDSTEAEISRLAASSTVPIRYFRNSARLGPGGSRNVGVSKAQGEIIAFTDSDTIPKSDWISCGIRPFLESRHLAGVEGSVIPLEEASISPFSDVIHNRSGGRYQCCSMFYRKSVLEQVGGFDERLFDAMSGVHFREDLDLAIAIMKNYGVIQFQPEAAVYHPSHRPCFRRPIDLAKRYMHDPLLMRKHTGLWRSYIDPLRLGPLRMSMPRHKLYAFHLGFAALTAVALGVSDRHLLYIGVLAGTLTAVGVLQLHWRICKRPSVASLLLSVPVILACPYVFAYAFAKGWLRARKLQEKT